ncbi:hypothetical protein CC85DRAFT_283575 [Cutaneotrichosporon oleaginosum]|uniref:Uncharacterized protein n=1 Tax=Cutaneotrichosporon oleaginosum TaxID=879819 RepID=A0A0J0XTB3_9TREE|nr:uncharacterized protein CC85DRAFT_283575 [Cutaneotrichosporon oleaginosum]KLT44332.1 hypothetical protein CC85DRAFT_283575 [Cutaneotrichosporon oleaginosum]TXT07940.1 hypothetical protein COLE_04864 [Cutaneotrichosporon oleaginosum]
MPTELLAFPPAYTVVGAYRLWNDPTIRAPVVAKLKHATIRGLAVGAAYAIFGWGVMDWVVRRFMVRGRVGERVSVGAGSVALSVDLVLYTHIMWLLPQLSRMLKFFIKKNLRIARGRAYNLTLTSRGKPEEFWSKSYYEEWAQPPQPTREQARAWGARKHREPWVSWMLWWPSQMLIRQYILFPLSPALPLLAPLAIAGMRALGTAEYLHQPYFQGKRMGSDEIWRWIEERKWAYRSFGFCASLLEGIPILGLWFSVSNRIGAAMWAHDLEKRQHLFAHHILQPLAPSQVGIFGSGNGLEITPEVVAAEKRIEAKWSARPAYIPPEIQDDGEDTPAINAGPPPLPPRDAPPAYSEVPASASASARRQPPQLPPRLPPRPKA